MKKRDGFSLIEVLIGVVIIGIVSGLTIPNMITAMHKGKQKSTIADLNTLSNAIESYIVDHGYAPADLSFGGNSSKQMYIRNKVKTDFWGNIWFYKRDQASPDIYSIGSPGKDSVFDGFEQTGSYRVTKMSDFNKDIIISNGAFVYGPFANGFSTGGGSGNDQGASGSNNDNNNSNNKASGKKNKKKKKKKKKNKKKNKKNKKKKKKKKKKKDD